MPQCVIYMTTSRSRKALSLALCEGIPIVNLFGPLCDKTMVDSPYEGPDIRSCDGLLVVRLKVMNKLPSCRWFETPWRPCDVIVPTRNAARCRVSILVWTQRVKPGFMHALGNPSLCTTLSEGANRRAANRVSWIPRSGWIPGARCLDFSVAPVLVVWTP